MGLSLPSTVCIKVPRSRDNCNRRISLRLEQLEELDLRTSNPSAKDHPKTPDRQSHSTATRPPLERSIMVSSSATNTGGLSTPATPSSRSDFSAVRTRESTPNALLTPVNCMTLVQERYRAGGLSEAATKVLLSFCESTQRFYCR